MIHRRLCSLAAVAQGLAALHARSLLSALTTLAFVLFARGASWGGIAASTHACVELIIKDFILV